MTEQTDVRRMSAQDFAALGMFDIAFVKPVMSSGGATYEIHTADGQLVADAPSWDEAVLLIQENEMQAARIH
ncbi:DUF1150 domain-containing protein [Nisaea acidiphila]|uniref:DUF1150 domain-containing protein n=1 Tax=Nisaea acidiphila TaxID=1862145 RepID=A0A9J7AZA1_9PROT|nr:DUF1150 domain-containing protein [Nisaea acidiphila]UUX51753.1 DUF1150 domain-containing protein [Nisaea acidiphila]